MFSETADILVVIGFIISFVLSFGIGANDVANSFGTSVGSKVLTLKMACILATIFESMGAILLGSGVWLIIATFFHLPVSATHSMVGATIGSGIVVLKMDALHMEKLGFIAISWVASPIVSGLVSTVIYFAVRTIVLRKDEPLEPGLRLLPGFYGTVVLVNIFSIFYSGPPMFHFNKIPLYGIFIISCGCGIITALMVKYLLIPRMRRKFVDGIKIAPKWIETLDSFFQAIYSRLSRLRLTVSTTTGPNSGSNSTERATSTDALTKSSDADASPTSSNSDEVDNNKIDKDKGTSQSNGILRRTITTTTTGPNSGSNSTERATSTDALTKSSDADASPTSSTSDAVDNNKIDKDKGTSQSNGILRRTITTTTTGPNSGSNSTELATSTDALTKSSDADASPTSSTSDAVDNNKIVKDDRASELKSSPNEDGDVKSDDHQVGDDRPSEWFVFSSLQIITAVFGSFAHGANDVSNAIGPLIGLWIVGNTGKIDSTIQTPIWILVYGGIGMSVGLVIWGRRVIKTIGSKLTKVTPSSGVCIELGAALTVLVASKIGMPVSTTHCQVGSVVAVGWLRSRSGGVKWRLLGKIVASWIVTLPAAGLILAGVMLLFTFFLL